MRTETLSQCYSLAEALMQAVESWSGSAEYDIDYNDPEWNISITRHNGTTSVTISVGETKDGEKSKPKKKVETRSSGPGDNVYVWG
ncbi:MAG: hypothetical protein JRI67_11120 [Deltaproteobacteria bacterium]|nr:hypothetical protein [Deltaproteobacteria bacterium]MBW2081425.1 hypothetical protein [Deltaproteobacteria bacterium]